MEYGQISLLHKAQKADCILIIAWLYEIRNLQMFYISAKHIDFAEIIIIMMKKSFGGVAMFPYTPVFHMDHNPSGNAMHRASIVIHFLG